ASGVWGRCKKTRSRRVFLGCGWVDWRRALPTAGGRCLAAAAAFLPVSTAVAEPVWIGAEEPVSIRVEGLGVPAELAVPLVVDVVEGLAGGRGGIDAAADGSAAA